MHESLNCLSVSPGSKMQMRMQMQMFVLLFVRDVSRWSREIVFKWDTHTWQTEINRKKMKQRRDNSISSNGKTNKHSYTFARTYAMRMQCAMHTTNIHSILLKASRNKSNWRDCIAILDAVCIDCVECNESSLSLCACEWMNDATI